MRLAGRGLAPRNLWFGKGKNERVGDEEPLITGWPCVTHSMEQQLCCAQLLKGTVSKGIYR